MSLLALAITKYTLCTYPASTLRREHCLPANRRRMTSPRFVAEEVCAQGPCSEADPASLILRASTRYISLDQYRQREWTSRVLRNASRQLSGGLISCNSRTSSTFPRLIVNMSPSVFEIVSYSQCFCYLPRQLTARLSPIPRSQVCGAQSYDWGKLGKVSASERLKNALLCSASEHRADLGLLTRPGRMQGLALCQGHSWLQVR